jgi:hypothetical protein
MIRWYGLNPFKPSIGHGYFLLWLHLDDILKVAHVVF